jgi:hypothetical protein
MIEAPVWSFVAKGFKGDGSEEAWLLRERMKLSTLECH